MTRITSVIICFILLISSVHAANNVSDETKAKYQAAIGHMQKRDFREAVKLFESVLKEYESPAVLWNYGIATGELGNHGKSLKAWQRYLKIAPGDWRVEAKLIQSYQALGQLPQRDREITKLVKNWKTTKDQRFKQANKFCREQFFFKNTKFFVFEYFKPQGDTPVYYEFIATDDSGKPAYRISLGSYQFTNEIAWETGELPRDKRLFHLDRYENNLHQTYRFFEEKPGYDDVRVLVFNILQGKIKPESSTRN